MSADVTRHVARVAGAAARILGQCPAIADVDRRRVLLDAAGELLASAIELLGGRREPADGSAQVLTLVRGIAADHETLSRECEGQLRERVRLEAR